MPNAQPDDAARDDLINHCGKMQVLEKLLAKLHAGGHRVLIFSGFLGMLDLLERFCEMKRYKYLKLTGATSRVQRKFDVARFNSDNSHFIYLISTRAGGLGVNLQAADTVIHYDSGQFTRTLMLLSALFSHPSRLHSVPCDATSLCTVSRMTGSNFFSCKIPSSLLFKSYLLARACFCHWVRSLTISFPSLCCVLLC